MTSELLEGPYTLNFWRLFSIMEILKIDVQTQPKSYEICIGYHFVEEIVQTIKEHHYGSRYAIITDKTVRPLHGDILLQAMKKQNLDVAMFDMPAGEAHKTRATKDWLDDQLLNNHYGRDSVIIALGGGVVGDVAGFVASTYMCGVFRVFKFQQRLSLRVIAALEVKQLLMCRRVSNLIGAFFHPQMVFIDIHMLETLDERNYNSGLIEIVKHGFIRSWDFYSFINNNLEVILQRNSAHYPEVMTKLMKDNCAIKNKKLFRQMKKKEI